MNRKWIALPLCLCLAAPLSGCGGAPVATPTPAACTPTPAPQTADFTDSAGRTVTVPANIERIALSGPLAQTVLLSLSPDLFVGISAPWDASAEGILPEAYFNLPLLGQLYGGKGELNLEELAAADPQVIIDVGEPKSTIVEDLDGLGAQVGIPFVHITATTDKMGDAYRLLGKLLGREERAETLAAYCENTLDEMKGLMDKVGENRARILYCVGDTGTNVIAKGSYHGEIFDLLADNLAVVDEPTSKGTGNEVDMEQLLLWDPDIIVFSPDSIYNTVREEAAWREMTAIRTGAYCEAPMGPYNWMGFPPSVQRYLGMFWLAAQLYPDYVDYDLYEKTAEYFELFYGCTLTRGQFDALTAHGLAAEKE